MLYYIDDIYIPNSSYEHTYIYFREWLRDFHYVEDSFNWTFSGRFYFLTNSYLPNHSYSLEIHTSYFDIRDIDLQFEKEHTRVPAIEGYNTGNYSYNIDSYTFSANVNLKNSDIYKQDLSNKDIDVNMKISFNQAVLHDFKFVYHEEDRKKFIDAIDRTTINEKIVFSNTYNLKEEENVFKLTDDTNVIKFSVPNFKELTTPLIDILNIAIDNQNPFKIKQANLKLKYKIDGEDKFYEYNEELYDIVCTGKNFSISLSNSYSFDYDKKEIVKIPNNSRKGIFIPMNASGFLDFEFVFENSNVYRKVILSRDFSFNNTFYQSSINTLKVKLNEQELKQFNEVNYGK